MEHGTGEIHQSGLGANCCSQSSGVRNLVRWEKLSRSCMRATLRSVLPWSTATGCSSGAPPCCTRSQRARSPCGSTHETRNFVLHRFTFDWRAERKLAALFLFRLLHPSCKRVPPIEIKDWSGTEEHFSLRNIYLASLSHQHQFIWQLWRNKNSFSKVSWVELCLLFGILVLCMSLCPRVWCIQCLILIW